MSQINWTAIIIVCIISFTISVIVNAIKEIKITKKIIEKADSKEIKEMLEENANERFN